MRKKKYFMQGRELKVGDPPIDLFLKGAKATNSRDNDTEVTVISIPLNEYNLESLSKTGLIEIYEVVNNE